MAKVTPGTVGVSFAFAAIASIFFGCYSARKATHLKPMVALRYEQSPVEHDRGPLIQ